jgi:hypothetical protein
VPPSPVYSKRIFNERNAGGGDFVNASQNTLILRTFVVYYGGDPASRLFLLDELGGAMLTVDAPGIAGGSLFTNNIWTDLHLVWAPGQIWHVQITNNEWDYSAHGYELSGPPPA